MADNKINNINESNESNISIMATPAYGDFGVYYNSSATTPVFFAQPTSANGDGYVTINGGFRVKGVEINGTLIFGGNLTFKSFYDNSSIYLTSGDSTTPLGYNNFYAGYGAGNHRNSANKNNNTVIGSASFNNVNSGDDNTALGFMALKGSYNAVSANNTAIGSSTLSSITNAVDNTAVGYSALKTNTIGSGNTAVGVNALINNTAGSDNVAVGAEALNSSTSSTRNVSIGTSSLKNLEKGDENTALGFNSLFYLTTGTMNSAFGNFALSSLLEGSHNIAIGSDAGAGITDGSRNIFIGNNAGSSVNGILNNKLIIANSSVNPPLIEGDFSVPSLNINGNLTVNGQPVVPGGGEAYDYIIDSQGKFNALIASPNWLGAKRVLLAADVEVTQQIVVPSSVDILDSNGSIFEFNLNNVAANQSFVCMRGYSRTKLNGVVIHPLTNINSQISITGFSGFWNMTNCDCDITAGQVIGYDNCHNLTNCYCYTYSYSMKGYQNCSNLENCILYSSAPSESGGGYGFINCTNINNCQIDIYFGEGNGYFNCQNIHNSTAYLRVWFWGEGMTNCSKIFGCDVNVEFANTKYLDWDIYSYRNCDQIYYSTARSSMVVPANSIYVYGGYSYGFRDCKFITNCVSVGEYKNTGGASETYIGGYDYVSCSFCNGCESGKLTSGYKRTAIWGGANTFVDVQSCRM